jgi:urea transport system ATP-binding protein
MTELLNLRNVQAAYGKAQVLWDVSLDMNRGSTAAVIGRNGVGKTTLLRTIVGLHKVSGGQVVVSGYDRSSAGAYERARAGIGYVPQGRHVFPHLTVDENIKVGLSALTGRKLKDSNKVADYIYELFPKLTQIAQRKAGVLSGGEQQQLAIGRALAGRPSLLLLDEPTEGIQPNVVQQIEDALSRIRTELGVAILIVEQNLDFAWSFADRYYVMQRGRVIRDGETKAEKAADVAHLVHI